MMIPNAATAATATCAPRRNGLARMDVRETCLRYALPVAIMSGTRRIARDAIGYSGETRGEAPGKCITWTKGRGLH